MRPVFKLFAYALSSLLSALSADAQEQDAIFADYNAMRSEMDRLIQKRNIQDLMLRFGGADEMTIQQLDNLDAQVDRLYPDDFQNVAVIRRVTLENGFSQELLAYWTGYSYLYAYVFYHDRGDEVISINFRFNSDFATLSGLF